MNERAIIIGVGAEEGLGAAVGRRFARAGFEVFLGGRTEAKVTRVAESIRKSGGLAHAISMDATIPADVIEAFERATENGTVPLDVAVFNAGNNANIPFLELTPQQFREFWEIGCYAGFLVGQEAVRRMLPNHRGTIVFTGASGSMRGRARYGHFAAAKSGLRMVGQAMAREFGPQGLHVAHVVVDGGINGNRLRTLRPHVVAERGEDGLLSIDGIAEMYLQLHLQPPTAWTHELDVRPYKESF